jgi:hypothetical protein
MRDLGDADVGIGQHRLGGLDIVVGEFRGASSSAAGAPPAAARPAWVRSRIIAGIASAAG